MSSALSLYPVSHNVVEIGQDSRVSNARDIAVTGIFWFNQLWMLFLSCQPPKVNKLCRVLLFVEIGNFYVFSVARKFRLTEESSHKSRSYFNLEQSDIEIVNLALRLVPCWSSEVCWIWVLPQWTSGHEPFLSLHRVLSFSALYPSLHSVNHKRNKIMQEKWFASMHDTSSCENRVRSHDNSGANSYFLETVGRQI